MASAPEALPMGTSGNAGQYVFTQGSPGYPLPAIAGPAINTAPIPPATPAQCQETTFLVPALPLPTS